MFFNNHKISYEIANVFHIEKRLAAACGRKQSRVSGLGYRISGNTLFKSRGKKYFADAGSFSFLPAHVVFDRVSTDEEMIVIHFYCHGSNEDEIQIFNPADSSKFAGYFFDILKTWEESAPGYKHRCQSLFYKMLEEMELYHTANPINKKEGIIKNSIVYMNSNFDNFEITISEIAEKSFISEVYFRKIYKEVFGISPGRAILEMRIKKAKELLRSGYFSVKEVSQKSGFDNVKYFSTVFKKEVGISPSEYKGL